MVLPLLVRLQLRRVASASVLLRLRLVISVASVASAASAVSVDPLPDLRLSLVLMQVSDPALLRLRPVASGLLLLRRVASGSVLLRLRLVISVASAVSAVSVVSVVSVVLLPDLRLSLVLMQVSDLALLRLRPVASGALPLAASVISVASVVSADSATLPLLAPLRLRRLASGLAQYLFLPLGSVLPASLRLRS